MLQVTLEEALYQFQESRAGLPQNFDVWVDEEGGIEGVAAMYDIDFKERYSHDFDNEDSEEEQKEKAFDSLRDELEDEFYKWTHKYKQLKFPLTVYRCVNVPQNPQDIEEKPHIGIHWSDDEQSAECHWGGAGKKHTLKAFVKENDIDWGLTLYHNMYPGLGEDEQEITLKEGAVIQLVGIQGPDKKWEKVDYKVKA